MVVVMGDGEVDDIRDEVVRPVPSAEEAFNVSSDAEDRRRSPVSGAGPTRLSASWSTPRRVLERSARSRATSRATSATSGKSAMARPRRSTTRPTSSVCTSATSPTRATTRRWTSPTSSAPPASSSSRTAPTETGGTSDTWQKSLHDFAQRVFQDPGDTGPSEGHLPLEPHALPAAGTTPTPWIDENGVVTFETGTGSQGRTMSRCGAASVLRQLAADADDPQEDGRCVSTMPVEAGRTTTSSSSKECDNEDQTNPDVGVVRAELEHLPGSR